MQKKKLHIIMLFLLLAVFTAGCGEQGGRVTDGSEVYVKRQAEDNEEESEEEEEEQEPKRLYMVADIDIDRQVLTLRDCESAREKPYDYTGGTYIKDKYGENLTVSQISEGELVTIEREGGVLTSVQISKDAFSYDDLYQFRLDKKKKSLTVGSASYYYDEDVAVYNGSSEISLSEISEQDTICLKGVGQQIYAIQVTTGHGTVVLENTELFQGGYITIGNVLAQKITDETRLEVTEGTYILSVANDGYGGSKEITIEANRETKVNLDELKGEGPKFCQIQFKLVPENTAVYIDGTQVDTSQPVQVRYGIHRLSASAEGYQEWTRTLVVNSEKGEFTIELSDQEQEEEDTVSTSGTSNTNTKKNTGSNGVNTNNTKSGIYRNNTGNNTNNNNNNNNNNNSNNNNNNSNNNNNNNNNNSNNNGNNNNNNSNNNNNNNNSGSGSIGNNGNDNSSNNNGNDNNNNNGNDNNNNDNNNGNDNNNNNGNNNNDDSEDDETGSGSIMGD